MAPHDAERYRRHPRRSRRESSHATAMPFSTRRLSREHSRQLAIMPSGSPAAYDSPPFSPIRGDELDARPRTISLGFRKRFAEESTSCSSSELGFQGRFWSLCSVNQDSGGIKIASIDNTRRGNASSRKARVSGRQETLQSIMRQWRLCQQAALAF